MRETDTVPRLGGDEFAVVLPDLRRRDEVEIAIDRVQSSILSPFDFEEIRLKLEARIGCAIFPEDAQRLEELMEIADQLMYRHKREKKAKAVK